MARMRHKTVAVGVLEFLSYNEEIGKVSYLGEDFARESSLGELILLLLSLQSIPCPFLFIWRERGSQSRDLP